MRLQQSGQFPVQGRVERLGFVMSEDLVYWATRSIIEEAPLALQAS